MSSEKPKKEKPAKDAPAAEGAEGEAPKKKGPPMMIIIIAAAAIVLLGGGAAVYFLVLAPKPAPAAASADATKDGGDAKGEKKSKKDKKKKDEKKGEGGAGDKGPKTEGTVRDGPDDSKYFTMPDLVVNIHSTDGRSSFLKLKLTFECDEDTTDVLEENMPRLKDAFQAFMRELRTDDLQGSQGNYQIRQEILRRVNLVIAPDKIKSVLIEEMIVQ